MAWPVERKGREAFAQEREVVRAGSGEPIERAEVQAFLAGLSEACFASVAFARRKGRPFIQPRGGFATLADQARLSLALSEAGADFIPLTIDSHTRHNDYDVAAELLRQSEATGRNLLNGFPLLAHGYRRTRTILAPIDKPFSLRHGTPDARLLVEHAIAAGITEIEGGGLTYCLPYARTFPVDRALLYWQYVDALVADHSTPGRPIHRESFGVLTATLVPPVMVIVTQLVELLLAAEQGVTSFSISFGQTGSFIQDLAIGRVMRTLARRHLATFGFSGVQVRLVFHQWMSAFPGDTDRAADLIGMATLIGRFVEADKIVIKTRHEALGVPPVEVNCEAVRQTRYILDTFSPVGGLTSPDIEEECALLGREVESVMSAIFDLGGRQFWESVHRAVTTGLIDVPYSPHDQNHNRLKTARGRDGAIRIVEPGRVPIAGADLASERRLLGAHQATTNATAQQILRDINIYL